MELAVQHAKDMEIVDLLLENETVYKELYIKGGDKVFICADKNTHGVSNEIKQ